MPLFPWKAVLCAAALLAAQPAPAAEVQCRGKSGPITIGPATLQELEAVAKLRARKSFAEAEARLLAWREKWIPDVNKAAVEQVLGDVYREQGRYADARAAFGRALDYGALPDPEIDRLRFLVGYLHFLEGHNAEALQVLEQARAAACGPPAGASHFYLATVLAEAGRDAEALDSAERALESGAYPHPLWVELAYRLNCAQERLAQCARRLVQLASDPRTPASALEGAAARVRDLRQRDASRDVIRAAEDEGVFDLEGRPARTYAALTPLVRIRPDWPPSHRRSVGGYVLLKLLVNVDGTVKTAAVIESQPEGVFDRAAIEAVLRWKFRPAAEDGVARPQWALQRFDFQPD